MDSSDSAYLSAAQLRVLLDAGDVSAAELTKAAISRIEQLDGAVNAVCVRDFDRAIDAAREADTARAAGRQGPLLGIPMTVKESFNIAGLPTTWGMLPFKDFKPVEDALAVARLKAAGAVILGKTNVPFGLGDFQSYNDIYGTTVNPWDRSRTPGGSSGGSAAALAAGFGALSIGSDIGGSLRIPAHCCGVYAHKSTLGLLPPRGHVPPGVPALPSENDLAVIGPMARSAEDLQSMLEILAEPDPLSLGLAYRRAQPAARHERLADFKVLVLDSHPLLTSGAEVRTSIDALAGRLAGSGADVLRASPLLPDLASGARLYMRLLFSVFGARWPEPAYEAFRTRAEALDPRDTSLGAERTRGVVLSHRDWMAADAQRVSVRARWQRLFETIDVVVCPVMPVPAFPIDEHTPIEQRRLRVDDRDVDYSELMVWPGVATVPGLPATSAPIGLSADGLPIGVQIVGPMYGDLTTIRFAALLEREFGAPSMPKGLQRSIAQA